MSKSEGMSWVDDISSRVMSTNWCLLSHERAR